MGSGGNNGIPMGASICQSILSHLENASPWICLMDFCDADGFDHQVGDNRDVQEFGVKGHLGVIWGHYSNILV